MRNNKMFENKKGNMWATMLIPVIFIFVFGLLTFIGFSLYSESYQGFIDSGVLSATGTQVFEDMGNGILMLDWIAIIIVVAMIIASTWFLSKEDHSPVEFVAAWIMLGFVGFIGYVFSFAFGQFFTESTMYTVSLMFPKLSIIGTNAHWIVFGSFIISQLFLYNKKRRNDVGAGNEPI